MLAFERPFLLALLLVIPLLWWAKRRARGSGLRLPLRAWRGPVFEGRPLLVRACRFLAGFLFWLGFASLVVAAAGPARVSRRILYLSRGNEIIFVLDVSPSMAASDFRPTRLEASKAIIDSFLQGRRNETVGLVAFGQEAALICPPTLDYAALRNRLGQLQPGQFGDGTALGSGIATALAHSSSSGAPRKYVILLTDGESNAGAMSPSLAVSFAARRGVAVSVIGVGSRGDVPLTYVDPETGVKRTGSYKSEFDRDALAALALAGGGRYYSAENDEALTAAFSAISEESASLAKTRSMSQEESLVRLVLAFGLAALVLARLLELAGGGDFL
jgi:Ca-activated chloride channel family protein